MKFGTEYGNYTVLPCAKFVMDERDEFRQIWVKGEFRADKYCAPDTTVLCAKFQNDWTTETGDGYVGGCDDNMKYNFPDCYFIE